MPSSPENSWYAANATDDSELHRSDTSRALLHDFLTAIIILAIVCTTVTLLLRLYVPGISS